MAEGNFIKIMTGSQSRGNKTKEIFLDGVKGQREKVWFSIEGQIDTRKNNTDLPAARLGNQNQNVLPKKTTNDHREVIDVKSISENLEYLDQKSVYPDERDDRDLIGPDEEIKKLFPEISHTKIGRQVPPRVTKHRKSQKKRNHKRNLLHQEYNDPKTQGTHSNHKLAVRPSRLDYDQDYSELPSQEELDGRQGPEEYIEHPNQQSKTTRPSHQEPTESSLYPDYREVSKHVDITGHQENTKATSKQPLTVSISDHSKHQSFKEFAWHPSYHEFMEKFQTITDYPNYYYYWEAANAKQLNLKPLSEKKTKRKSLQSFFGRHQQKKMRHHGNQKFGWRPNKLGLPIPFNSKEVNKSLNDPNSVKRPNSHRVNRNLQKLESLARQLRQRFARRRPTSELTTKQTTHTNQRIEISFVTQSPNGSMELKKMLATHQPGNPIIPLGVQDFERALPVLKSTLQKRFSVVDNQGQVQTVPLEDKSKVTSPHREQMEDMEKALQIMKHEDKKYRVTNVPKRFEVIESELKQSKFYNAFTPPQIIHKIIYSDDGGNAYNIGQRPYGNILQPNNDERIPDDNLQNPYHNEQRPPDNLQNPYHTDQRPQDNEERPSDNEERPSNNEERPTDNEERPSNNEERPTDNEERLSNNEERPSDNEERHQDNLQPHKDNEERPQDNLQPPKDNVEKTYKPELGNILRTTEEPSETDAQKILIKLIKNAKKSQGKRKRPTKKPEADLPTASERIVPIEYIETSYEKANKTSHYNNSNNNKELKKILRKILRNSKINIDSLLQTISETNMIENVTEVIMQKMFEKLIKIKMNRIKQDTKDLKSKVEKITKSTEDMARLKHEAESVIKIKPDLEDIVGDPTEKQDSTEVIQIVVDKNGLVLQKHNNEGKDTHKRHKKHNGKHESHMKHNVENRVERKSNKKHNNENREKDKKKTDKNRSENESADVKTDNINVNPVRFFTKMN